MPASGKQTVGLTLLEVLAAVALLGLVFTALARAGNEGIASEGKSRRRLEASLLADARLAEIELGLQEGSLPALGITEAELGEFRLEIESRPWALPPELQEMAAAALSTSGAQAVFADPSGREEGLVREIALRVFWEYGTEELFVERTTFAVDFVSAGAVAGSPPVPPGGRAGTSRSSGSSGSSSGSSFGGGSDPRIINEAPVKVLGGAR